MQDGQLRVYQQKNLTFFISPQKIVIRTALGQTFYLHPKMHYWQRRVERIRNLIEINKIEDLNHLAEWCANGNVEWVSTSHRYSCNVEEAVLH